MFDFYFEVNPASMIYDRLLISSSTTDGTGKKSIEKVVKSIVTLKTKKRYKPNTVTYCQEW